MLIGGGLTVMAETKFTTRVYQYGAVPLGQFPEEGIDALYKANKLWNSLVEIHNTHSEYYDQSRRDTDTEYNTLKMELEALEETIKKAFDKKRNARMKAQTRSSDHPLIKAVNDEIDILFGKRRDLWDAIKPARKRADDAIDKKGLNKAFNNEVKLAQRFENTGGLDGNTANEVGRNFKEARSRIFSSPRSRLRYHRFDGSGFRFYRFRDKTTKTTTDGVPFSYFTPLSSEDDRAFLLEPSKPRRGVPRLKLLVSTG